MNILKLKGRRPLETKMPAQRSNSVWGGAGRCAGGALKLEFGRDGVVRRRTPVSTGPGAGLG